MKLSCMIPPQAPLKCIHLKRPQETTSPLSHVRLQGNINSEADPHQSPNLPNVILDFQVYFMELLEINFSRWHFAVAVYITHDNRSLEGATDVKKHQQDPQTSSE